jgi:hypothetical protein
VAARKKGGAKYAVLRLMGLFDRPADAACLNALRSETIPGLNEPIAGLEDDDWEFILSALEDAKLLTVNRDGSGALLSLDAHPLLREYFARQLRGQRPEAWRAAHRRLYEHLCATTKDKPQPKLEDLLPLYQAVAHGCQAQMQEEALGKVYVGRILRRREHYSKEKLGAFGSDLGAVACFFEQQWGRISPALSEKAQSFPLNEAAVCLRALGRLTEALEPMRAGLGTDVKRENWSNAANDASNLSQLELTLGEVALAAEDAAQAVTYAERIGDLPRRLTKRITYADALHQAGRQDEAAALFREAEQLVAGRRLDQWLLGSYQGFLYCDFLLAPAERAAWRRILNLSSAPEPLSLQESCRAYSDRASRALQGPAANIALLDTALTHLTLGRAALYEAALEGIPLDQVNHCRESLQRAVEGLRCSGQQDELSRGLLTRAWLRCLTGAGTGPESAQSDLNEAWEIAERGPMPLFMADVHLHRARLFGLCKDRPANYPWASPQYDLAEAQRLIEKHGYWRRKEELEDAEAAAHGVSDTHRVR